MCRQMCIWTEFCRRVAHPKNADIIRKCISSVVHVFNIPELGTHAEPWQNMADQVEERERHLLKM